ncbi:MAG: hypothetical protein ABI364_03730 [Caldimonas sp.]
MLRRPSGPSCHGGASSLLRVGFGAAPRAATPLVSGWRELAEDADRAHLEHVVGWRGRSDRGNALFA